MISNSSSPLIHPRFFQIDEPNPIKLTGGPLQLLYLSPSSVSKNMIEASIDRLIYGGDIPYEDSRVNANIIQHPYLEDCLEENA